MARTEVKTVAIKCDICDADMPAEPTSFMRITLGYRPVDAVGVIIGFGAYGTYTNEPDVCQGCRLKALKAAVAELERALPAKEDSR